MATLIHPIATERAISQIDKNNVIAYIVDSRATKPEIRKAFEGMFGVKVENIRTLNLPTNRKKAFIKIAKGFKASDVASKLKLV